MPWDSLPLPVSEWEGAHVQTLPKTERAALVDLLVLAWRDPDCCIPGDHPELATLCGLAGAWWESELRRRLYRWFQPTADGRLLCTLLEPAHVKQTARSAAGRLAGRISGEVRRAGTGQIAGTTTGPAAAGTAVQPSLSDRRATFRVAPATTAGYSTSDAQDPTGSPGERSFNPRSSTPFQEAQHDGRDEACVSDAVSVESTSPHTPIKREISQSHNSSGEGGKGEGADLFGRPIRTARMSPKDRELVGGLVDLYLSNVTQHWRVRSSAYTHVYGWLRKGASVEQLETAVLAYARAMDQARRLPEYRLAPHNFFHPGEERGVSAWVSGPPSSYAARQGVVTPSVDGSIASIGERLKTRLGASAPTWYAEAAQQLAALFRWSHPDDVEFLAASWPLVQQAGVDADALAKASTWMATQARFVKATISRTAFRASLLYYAGRMKAKAEERRQESQERVPGTGPREDVSTPDDWVNSDLRKRMWASLGKRPPATPGEAASESVPAVPSPGGADASSPRGKPMHV
jgi:hypothetical protein